MVTSPTSLRRRKRRSSLSGTLSWRRSNPRPRNRRVRCRMRLVAPHTPVKQRAQLTRTLCINTLRRQCLLSYRRTRRPPGASFSGKPHLGSFVSIGFLKINISHRKNFIRNLKTRDIMFVCYSDCKTICLITINVYPSMFYLSTMHLLLF